MKPELTIINYHNVDWENSIMVRALGGTVRPDVFREHLRHMQSIGNLVSIQEGLEAIKSQKELSRPMFAIWFDDGFRGIRKYALPILNEFGVTAATSISSRFVLRKEMYWRSELSYLALTDGLRALKSKIRSSNIEIPQNLRGWSRKNFTLKLREMIKSVYENQTTEYFKKDAFRIFDSRSGLKELQDAGWLITNHSASHYPFTENLGWETIKQQYEECDFFVQEFNQRDKFWVVPFNFSSDLYLDKLKQYATIVYVRNKVNTYDTLMSGVIYRHSAPTTRIFSLKQTGAYLSSHSRSSCFSS